eukprot:SAG31_NODE_122_length_23797_cov_39.343812_6_plen_62_part_00
MVTLRVALIPVPSDWPLRYDQFMFKTSTAHIQDQQQNRISQLHSHLGRPAATEAQSRPRYS